MDDCVEIFLCPNPKNRKQCYQFIINAKGVTWDGRHGSRKDGRVELAWNSGIKARSIIQKNRWILEVKIPLKDYDENSIRKAREIVSSKENHKGTNWPGHMEEFLSSLGLLRAQWLGKGIFQYCHPSRFDLCLFEYMRF